ncbi:hypothetical protein [Ruegeria atlantica]|uniref:hypothetical protein n=1 Tax=Ruegeria atlantica TaxID=81569 RepID=UPI00147D3A2F|nr:hypothetical protein [Ruegeria atlantica]
MSRFETETSQSQPRKPFEICAGRKLKNLRLLPRFLPSRLPAFTRILTGTALALMATACGNVVETSNRNFNSGISEGQASTILANIVRSAKGYPTYFTVAGDFQQSTQLQSSPSLNYDFGIDGGTADLSVGLAPSASTSSSATASSLETSEFTEAMHTQVSSDLLVKLAESRDEAHLHLTFMLLIQTIVLRQETYNGIINSAQAICGSRAADLPASQRGICRGMLAVEATNRCPKFAASSKPRLVRFVNDPTALCQFERFRTLMEAVAVLQPHLGVSLPESDDAGASGRLLYLGDSADPARRIFTASGTGYRLRSPSQVVFYLGQLINETYSGVDQDRLSISTRHGGIAPIFHVEVGPGEATVSTVVDGEKYRLLPQKLGAQTNDFSHRSLTLVKDLIALNTLQTQIPQNTAIFVGTTQ